MSSDIFTKNLDQPTFEKHAKVYVASAIEEEGVGEFEAKAVINEESPRMGLDENLDVKESGIEKPHGNGTPSTQSYRDQGNSGETIDTGIPEVAYERAYSAHVEL